MISIGRNHYCSFFNVMVKDIKYYYIFLLYAYKFLTYFNYIVN